MSAYFHSYLCGRKAAEWLIDMDVLKVGVFVCTIICLFFICFTWPVKLNRKFKERYGSNGWSWPVSAGIAILALATLYESGTGAKFALLLMATILFSVLMLMFCFVRAKGLSGDIRTALAVAAAQMLSAFGIIFVVLVFLESASDRKRKK